MHRIHRLTRSILMLFVLTFAVLQARAQVQPKDEAQNPDPVIQKPDVVIHVTGLVCALCARSVTNTLKKVEGVQEVQVLLEDDQRILLTVKAGVAVDETTLREAVTSAGFSTRKVDFKPMKDSSP